ncbi:hypothetical protein K1T71_011784 [Dendrolimus kikuchii]|uniref:Uncharacterized protein n=1 Tax=Dendrolimus kikuchii TaxID=765133 RepID=A0ACC1CMC0_9NEOP|nr:hypothetical protein K1T71_011784 [Dendrolimus kikuchii]
MDLILEVKSSQIEDVVVVTFNDPDTKLCVKSRNRTNVMAALRPIHAHSSRKHNPCPEYAMSGVYLGLNNSRPGSSLFVFTDSGAEDEYLDTQVIDLCQKTQSMFTIDGQVEYGLITVTGHTKDLNILYNGKIIKDKKIIWSENIKAIQMDKPNPGDYQVLVSDHDRITIDIAGRTDFTFEHGFSIQWPKVMNGTTQQPIAVPLMDYGEMKNIFRRKDFNPTEDDKKLKCPLPYKTPESITWFLNGFSINGTGATVNIVNYTDSNYTCLVIDKLSSSYYTFVLNIVTPPEFVSNVNQLEWNGLNEEQVNCEVTADPEAQIEWYYNDKKIDDKNNVTVRPITGWGKYMCRASNLHGTIEKTIVVKSRDCLIKRLDYTQNTPLVLVKVFKRGKSTLAWPEYAMNSAHYSIGSKKTVTLSCAGDDYASNYFKRFPGINEIDVTCDHEDKFVVNGTVYNTSDLLCDRKITATVVNTGEICQVEGIQKLKIGFKASEFVELYEACYDSLKAMTHTVLPVEGTWRDLETVPGLKWYQYQYNCNDNTLSCLYAKSQLLKAGVEPHNNSASIGTYINNINVNVFYPSVLRHEN